MKNSSMKNKYNSFVGFFFAIGVVISCSPEQPGMERPGPEISQVRYGTSFGECIGYCRQDLAMRPGNVTYNRSGWTDTVEPLYCQEILDKNAWNSFSTSLDINTFFNLPATIGCPDCADGGAEWVELEIDNSDTHRVTFEYHHEPPELRDYVSRLRQMMENSSNCFQIQE
jgi:hypothetical protein